jgi:hypothetical protein
MSDVQVQDMKAEMGLPSFGFSDVSPYLSGTLIVLLNHAVPRPSLRACVRGASVFETLSFRKRERKGGGKSPFEFLMLMPAPFTVIRSPGHHSRDPSWVGNQLRAGPAFGGAEGGLVGNGNGHGGLNPR